jgi:hypothetical protein
MTQDGQINPANDVQRKSAHLVKATRRLQKITITVNAANASRIIFLLAFMIIRF